MDQAVYTCQYIVGPYTPTNGFNMCGDTLTSGAFTTTIVFDSSNGSLTFNTDDYETFPPGSYEYIITITIGTSQRTVNVSIILNEHCGTNQFTIVPVTQPQQTTYHHLSSQAMCFFVYNINSLVTYTSTI